MHPSVPPALASVCAPQLSQRGYAQLSVGKSYGTLRGESAEGKSAILELSELTGAGKRKREGEWRDPSLVICRGRGDPPDSWVVVNVISSAMLVAGGGRL